MKLLLNHLESSVNYAFGDRNALIVIGILMIITSIINKNNFIHPIFSIFTFTMIFAVGYGSYVSWYAINGLNKHPDIKNFKILFFEGFKKSLILAVYSIALTLIFNHASENFINGNIINALIFTILFVLIYIVLIGGLINRYLNHGQMLKAFNLAEIIKLFSHFDAKSFIKIIAAAAISHIFAISVVIDFHDKFIMPELIYSLLTFFLAPFFFIAMKRFIGLNLRDVLYG